MSYFIIEKLKKKNKKKKKKKNENIYIYIYIYFSKYSLKDADKEQIKLLNILKSLNESVKTVEKRSFLNNIGLFLSAREKILNNFRI